MICCMRLYFVDEPIIPCRKKDVEQPVVHFFKLHIYIPAVFSLCRNFPLNANRGGHKVLLH